MRADVVIPFHARSDMVCRCLAALAPQAPDIRRVWLVDDGSTPGESARVRRACERSSLPIEAIATGRRGGFVAAVNLAWTRADAPIAIVLNSDTVPPPSLIATLTAVLLAYPQIAAVAPASDNRCDLYQYRGGTVVHDHRRNGITYVPYLTAMCMGIRRRAVESRLFDPIFSPGYFEDLDLCCRLRARGWRLAVLESCHIHHTGRATFALDPDLDRVIGRNAATFAARWSHLSEHADLLARMNGGGRRAGAWV